MYGMKGNPYSCVGERLGLAMNSILFILLGGGGYGRGGFDNRNDGGFDQGGEHFCVFDFSTN